MFKREKLIKDIMNKKIIKVKKGTLINDVVNILIKNKISGVPIIDKKDKLIGVVSEKSLFNAKIKSCLNAKHSSKQQQATGRKYNDKTYYYFRKCKHFRSRINDFGKRCS